MTPLQGLEYWVARFGKTRKRLYWLTVSFGTFALTLLLAAKVLGEGTEPCCRWAAEMVGFVIPGLPSNLVELWARYLWPVSLLLLIALLLAVVVREIRLEEDECAFQAKRYASAGVPPPCALRPTFVARCVAWLAPLFPPVSVVLFAASAVLLLVMALIVLMPVRAGVPVPSLSANGIAADIPSCCPTVGPRRLGIGETVNVVVGVSRVRNETGLLVGEDERYEARYVSSRGWKDGGIAAKPWGIEFRGAKGFLPVGWNGSDPIQRADGSRWSAASERAGRCSRCSATARLSRGRLTRSGCSGMASWSYWSTMCGIPTIAAS